MSCLPRPIPIIAVAALALAVATPTDARHAGGIPGYHDPALLAEDGGSLPGHKQHMEPGGHLPGSSKNVKLVGKVKLTNVEDGIGDVAAFGSYAYLNAFSSECLGRPGAVGTGVHVVDIRDPRNPTKVGFLPAHPNSYLGEGIQVLRVNTAHFKGDLLFHNNESCDASRWNPGGVSIWDVTNPLAPVKLSDGFGDMTPAKVVEGRARASTTHSVRGWYVPETRKAYVVMTDNDEVEDVDIMDVSDPRNPVQIAEVSLLDWPATHSPLANGDTVFHHDMWIKKIKGHWYMLLAYWDAGYILLNVDDPKSPKFIGDTDFLAPDPLTGFAIPEGNGHQVTWSGDNKFILATDEDFSPFRTSFAITTGPNAGASGAGEFGWTRPIGDAGLFGKTVWGGSGCEEDLNGNGVSDRADVPPAASIPDTGERKIIVFTRGVCFFSIKVESGQLAGYDAVIIGNSHGGSRNGLLPDAFFCGGQGHEFTITASAICIGHRAMHLLFGDTPGYTGPDAGSAGGDMMDVPLGRVGASIQATTEFDGWGYLHVYDAKTLKEVGAYAVAESLKEEFASGFGDLTIHEVKTDPRNDVRLAYVSYYSAGLRVVEYGRFGLREVGHYIDTNGQDFWGTMPHMIEIDGRDRGRKGDRLDDDRPFLLMSDMDSGLWIFQYTGREPDDD